MVAAYTQTWDYRVIHLLWRLLYLGSIICYHLSLQIVCRFGSCSLLYDLCRVFHNLRSPQILSTFVVVESVITTPWTVADGTGLEIALMATSSLVMQDFLYEIEASSISRGQPILGSWSVTEHCAYPQLSKFVCY
jgi:hypothetical protein